MALMPRQDFASARMAVAIDGQIERARRDLTRALSLAHGSEALAAEMAAVAQGAEDM